VTGQTFFTEQNLSANFTNAIFGFFMNSGNVLFHHRLCEKLFWANGALKRSMFGVDAIHVVPQYVAGLKFQLKRN
jgi:hypothetical protein